MSSASPSQLTYDQSQVAAVRKAWINAILAEDIDQLAQLMADDIVVVRSDGRVATGKALITRGLLTAFERYDIEGTVVSSEIIVRDNWAIGIDEVEGSRTPVDSIEGALHTQSKAVFVFNRFDGPWKVSRIIELVG